MRSEIGAGPTNVEPAEVETTYSDTGGLEYGPSFVRFVVDRFAAVEQMFGRLLEKLQPRTREGWRFVKSGQTDADGNATIIIFESEPMQKYALHRMYVHAGGYTWSAPYTGGGEALINVNDSPWDGVSFTNTTPGYSALPCVFTASRLQAVEVQDGERLTLQIKSGPHSTRIEVRCVGVLTDVHGDDH